MPRFPFPTRSALAAALALAVALGVTGCDHTTDPDGPLLTDRFGPFDIQQPLAADRATVNFSTGEAVTFTAQFNKQTAWVLEITGQESGAVRRIEGSSRQLDASNARWTGRTTELPLFKDEAVTARLFFPNEPGSDTTSVDLDVTGARVYPGEIVANFEGGDNVRIGNFEFEFDLGATGPSSEVPAGEGNFFYLLRSTGGPVVADPFFIGLIDVLAPSGQSFHAVPTTVPEDLFVNFFLYGFGTPNTIAVVQVISDANGNGRFEDGDAVFVALDSPIDFTGWRAFSANLGDLGMTEAQAQEIVNVRVVLISDNNGQPSPPLPVDFGIDYITLTAGSPLQL